MTTANVTVRQVTELASAANQTIVQYFFGFKYCIVVVTGSDGMYRVYQYIIGANKFTPQVEQPFQSHISACNAAYHYWIEQFQPQLRKSA